MIILDQVALRRGPKLLFEEASVTLQPGQRIALVGTNGCGKSSLFAMLLGEHSPDRGDIEGIEALEIAHMAQEVTATDATARQYVMAGDARAFELLQQVAGAEAEARYEDAARLHHELDEGDGYSLGRRAEQLLLGLGFAQDQIDQDVRQFSGGWRIRLNLGRALMQPSDLLLLDEPTNHLDLDATLWLQNWLQAYRGTLLLISHDRDFIDAVCERTLCIEGRRLSAYRGGYSDYEQQRAERMSQQQATFEKQQRRKADIEDFVRRFRYKATKARQAQSRLKELERMQEIAPAHVHSPFRFVFAPPRNTSDPLLSLTKASLGYGTTPVLENVSLSLAPGDRLALLGRNGAGKTTLLKSLTGDLPLLGGERTTGTHLRVGYFDQQQLEVLDLDASPLLHLERQTPDVRQQEILDFLGGFNFHGDSATAPIAPLSGGEKARLALALVVWSRPNLLVLDEPTNHLDLEMRHALEVALLGFTGAVVLVSHDRHLLRNSADQLWLVDEGRIREYEDDLSAYENWLLGRLRAASVERAEAAKEAAATESVTASRKRQRQSAAELRAQLKPLKKAVEQTEKQVESLQTALDKLRSQLSDADLYTEDNASRLADLVKEEGAVASELATLEERWMAELEVLEVASERLSGAG